MTNLFEKSANRFVEFTPEQFRNALRKVDSQHLTTDGFPDGVGKRTWNALHRETPGVTPALSDEHPKDLVYHLAEIDDSMIWQVHGIGPVGRDRINEALGLLIHSEGRLTGGFDETFPESC